MSISMFLLCSLCCTCEAMNAHMHFIVCAMKTQGYSLDPWLPIWDDIIPLLTGNSPLLLAPSLTLVAQSTQTHWFYDLYMCGTTQYAGDFWAETIPPERDWQYIGQFNILYLLFAMGIGVAPTLWTEMHMFSEDYPNNWNYGGVTTYMRDSMTQTTTWRCKTVSVLGKRMWTMWKELYTPWQKDQDWCSYYDATACPIPEYKPANDRETQLLTCKPMLKQLNVPADYAKLIVHLWSKRRHRS